MGFPYSLLAPFAWHQRRRAALSSRAPESALQRFDQALKLLEKGDSAAAYHEFAALANEGHGPASRIALTLARRGVALFGGRYPSTPSERERWQQHSG